ncbi:MAG: asparagine synthase (glutamine-hydrolyzing) [Candidatus Rokuibacteriota bacterium]|nr:MAG: asparagine synthase (glutamine-hydrolyzing) [Candidatus Rokubacteria bacterium]
MCGICGIIGPDPVDRESLARMTRVLRHRGPDDEGFYVREYGDGVAVGLGFRRLSIIDLDTGNQPIANEDGSVQLVFNGEIYNFRELRRELQARGHRFSTRADTEVIVHLYEDVGVRCVERLNGMFAFALWDESRRELILARDRFGKKPLYYAALGPSLFFGSETKALIEHPRCSPKLDFESLARYLALEYVPTPRSIFEGVKKLPAGHVLRWRDGTSSTQRYWDLAFDGRNERMSDDEYAAEFRSRFREAVRRRLISDVPLGAFLSGGIDSSSVVAMMAEASPRGAVNTFSIGFEEPSFDESEHGRRVAAHFGTEHHEQVFTAKTMPELLPTVVDFLDEPFGDASILPTYLLSRFTREFVTVALGGDGSDELLAGYPTFPAERVARLYPVPAFLHERVVVTLADRVPVSTANFSPDFKLKRFLRGAGSPANVRHPVWLGSFTRDELGSLLVGSFSDPYAESRQAYVGAPTRDRLERLIYVYARTYLQDDILVKVDRASMACSLEVRAPFLDVELVEFLASVPPRLKLRRFDTKYLLKQAMAEVLPSGIVDRPKKGFGIPIAEWFKTVLREPLYDELSPGRLDRQGLFEPNEVQRLLSEHMSGRRDHRKPLWTLYMFQLWHRRWLENAGAPTSATRAAAPIGNPEGLMGNP